MQPADKKKITDNFSYLTEEILLTPVFLSHLISNRILTQDLKEEITNEYRNPTRSSKVYNFLERIFQRGPHAFPGLVEALVESEQGHIADVLDQTIADNYRAANNIPTTGGAGEANNIDVVPAAPPAGDAQRAVPGAPVAPASPGLPPSPAVLPSPAPPPGAGAIGGGDAVNYDTVDARQPEMCFAVQNASLEAISIALSERYRMSSDPRGRAIIVNVENFRPGSGKSVRTGSSVDRNNLEKLCRQLNFTVDIWDDPTQEDIIEMVKLEKDNEAHTQADAFIMFIMSHGSEGVFYTVEGHPVNITKDIINQFNGRNCQGLIGKPKMFFIQACQGNAKTRGVVPDGGAPLQAEPETKPDSNITRDAFLKQATHEDADVFVTYSTVEGYESYRDKSYGTWFVRDLVKVFAASAHRMDVSRMVTRVTGFVDNHPEYKYKQVCVTKGSVRKDIYLLPGYCDPCERHCDPHEHE